MARGMFPKLYDLPIGKRIFFERHADFFHSLNLRGKSRSKYKRRLFPVRTRFCGSALEVSLIEVITAAFRKFYEDDGTFLASGLAFGLLFYSVPFALLSVSALSYTF